ncbi:DUF3558 family protein [Amycolatopsis jejuensis]|uniref:DUF3558 family protein n=1 Tax=Amycolatopsis jejuensis TaxID=330084 RepID=UPI0005248F26|nr:DUF3558 family protein [Amycolatopsis jejuensis]
MGFRLALVTAVVAVLLTGCTQRVPGVASPVPGQGPVTQVVDPCTLLDARQLDALGYKGKGRLSPASKAQRTPALCLWSGTDDEHTVILSVGWAVDQTLDNYLQGAVVKAPPVKLGGLDWTRYGAFLGGSCDLYTTLGPKSFAFVSVSYPDDAKACDRAKLAIPQVAAHLPGGQPAPSITPTTTPPGTPPSGPLATLDACSLLKPEQAQQLKMAPQGELDHSKVVSPNVTYCLWKDTDGDRGQKPFEVWIGPDVPMKRWPGMSVAPVEQIDVGGRKWALFPNFNDSGVNCAAGLAVTETSSIQIVTGQLDNPDQACAAIKAGIPLVTGNLPS